MGSYRQWATMMQHVHRTHAEGVTEEETEEFLLAEEKQEKTGRARRESPERKHARAPGAARA